MSLDSDEADALIDIPAVPKTRESLKWCGMNRWASQRWRVKQAICALNGPNIVVQRMMQSLKPNVHQRSESRFKCQDDGNLGLCTKEPGRPVLLSQAAWLAMQRMLCHT